MRKTALTIAGSDCSGGAGVQADIKTMMANGVYAMSALTALTAQNTKGVSAMTEVSPEFLGQQMDAVFTDIFPDAVKIGMVVSEAQVDCIAERLRQYKAVNIVLDPVMASTSGTDLTNRETALAMQRELYPLSALVTPNIPEAEAISGMEIHRKADMEKAAAYIGGKYHCAVLLKGGHLQQDHGASGPTQADDLLWKDGKCRWFCGKRIDNPNAHGTGCTLSSAIAAHLAKGEDLDKAVEKAKKYLSDALLAMLNLGAGSGPMDHGFAVF